jgi:cytosine deaminase
MLVLTRQRDQTVMIGDDVQVTIVDVRGDKVRLGIAAPTSIKVHRKEIYEAIKRENESAAHLTGPLPGMEGAPLPQAVVPPTPRVEDPFMKAAIAEAKKGLEEGGLPIGSVLVRDGQIIAAGHNRRVQEGDPMAHAEIDCLRRAGRQKTFRDTVLYSTLMPCFLCSGAVVQFGVPRVIVGESVNFAGGPEFMRKHGVKIVDLHDPACIVMMRDFIRDHPELWHEDIGK